MNDIYSVKAQAERVSDDNIVVIVLSCYMSQPVVPYRSGTIILHERYDLYSRPDAFFGRLAAPDNAVYHHARVQREFVKQSNVFEFVFRNKTLWIEFNFDTTEIQRARIASAYNDGRTKKVKLND